MSSASSCAGVTPWGTSSWGPVCRCCCCFFQWLLRCMAVDCKGGVHTAVARAASQDRRCGGGAHGESGGGAPAAAARRRSAFPSLFFSPRPLSPPRQSLTCDISFGSLKLYDHVGGLLWLLHALLLGRPRLLGRGRHPSLYIQMLLYQHRSLGAARRGLYEQLLVDVRIYLEEDR